MSFYQTNTKILTKSIKGAETIDFNKYPDLLDILFNHWITQKENYNRLNDNFERGEFELSLTVIKNEFGVSDRKSRTLISNFVKNEIIRLKTKGTSANKKSIYVYLSVLENVENSDIVNDIVTAQFRHSKTLKNEHIGNNKGHSKDIVSDIVANNSKKELIKKNYKKEIYIDIFNFWNSKKIKKHRALEKDMEEAIKRTLKDFTVEQIKEAINNYAEMFHSDYEYCNHKWTLIEFLTRSQQGTKQRQLKLHLNEGSSYERYLEFKNNKQQIIEKPKAQLGKSSIDYSKMTPEQIMELGRG